MFGNLVCLSPTGKFDDPIWATVAEKDTELLNNQQIIELELVSEFNKISTTEALLILMTSANYAVMVESPIYFHSKKPVLKALQSFKMDKFTLEDEVVAAKSSGKKPLYLEDNTQLNVKSICNDKSSDLFIPASDIEEIMEESFLDKSQQRAFLSSLQNRVAIIQGPPGTGKTFIGLKLLEVILSMDPQPKLPVLLLTYKNHALDEFLKASLNFLDIDKVVRVGGRSKEQMLDEINLNKLKRYQHQDPKFDEVRAEREALEEQIKNNMEALNESSYFVIEDFLDGLNDEQLEAFLKDAQLKPKKFKDSGAMMKVFKETLHKYGSFKDFLQLQENALSNVEKNMKHTFINFLENWIPSADILETMKQIHFQLFEAMKKERQDTENNYENGEDDDDFDEQALEAKQEERMAPVKANGKEQRKVDGLTRFKSSYLDNEIIIGINNFPKNLSSCPNILKTKSLWKLTTGERITYLFTALSNKIVAATSILQPCIERLEELTKLEIELQSKAEAGILKNKKLVGMTITGASIHNKLIKQVSPAIVIVEEAAEVLEPDLIAALPESIQHLILIGDHKQLRPQVDTYKLRTKFNFDLSLMERLINNRFPFETLETQNRMRPEFSALLKDIYPDLKDNLSIVGNNKRLTCIRESMFFWDHHSQEKSGRSVTNEEEAARAIALVKYLLANQIAPDDITILAAYQGQVSLIRKKILNGKNAIGLGHGYSFVHYFTCKTNILF